MSTINFKNIFDKWYLANQKTWSHDRSATLGASETFQCLRKTWFTKNSKSPDDGFAQDYGALTRGNLIETHYVVPAVSGSLPPAAKLLWAGDDQVTLVRGKLSATPDGIITNLDRDALVDYGISDLEGDCILLEIKSFDPRLDIKEPKPVHVGQAQQQMGLVHECESHRPEYTVILYVNSSFVSDIRPFVVKRDPSIYESAKRRADKVFDATDAKELAPEGKIRGGSECEYCPFQKQCHTAQLGSLPPPDTKQSNFADAEDAQLTTLLSYAKKLDREAARIKAEAAQTDEAIREFLRKEGVRFGKVKAGYSVSWSTTAGRKRLDKDRLTAETGIDLEDYMVEGERSERLTVREPKGD